MAETANPYVGAARAAVGQGLGMGWGDEAEAWLRSKAGSGSYEDNLRRIREEYAQYSAQNPFVSGAAEFTGGVAPGVAMMLLPGGQAPGAAQVQRSTAGALARLALMGGATGTVSGAGSALEGERGSGAVSGGVMGTTVGLATPVAMRSAKGAYGWLRDRLAPSEAYVTQRAAQKMNAALAQEKMTPQQIESVMRQDASMGVPSVVANANPAMADLAQAVAQRTGAGTRNVEKTLLDQRLGSRERAHQQVVKGLKPGDYYNDLAQLRDEMRTLAGPAYQQAYAFGEVTDPKVLKYMKLPQFQQALKEADKLLKAEGRELDLSKPTVEVLDQVKRGLDSLIEGQTDTITGKTTSLGRVYTQKKNEFLKDLDKAVPDYEIARGIYAGGAELQDAMRKGLNEFKTMDHEQVIKLVAGMGQAEKEAFRTGVARDLYSRVMDPSGNVNAAQRIIGSPENQMKLQPLFDSPAHFNLFKNALEREAQMFQQSSKILGGSPTAKNIFMREQLDEGTSVGEAMARGAFGDFKGALTGMLMTSFRKGAISEKTADRLSSMLMSKNPQDVAAVVKLLEENAASAAPKALKASAAEAGAVTGTASAIYPSPSPEMSTRPGAETADIEKDLTADRAPPAPGGADIEADIEADSKPR
jgi:hypothetical protein